MKRRAAEDDRSASPVEVWPITAFGLELHARRPLFPGLAVAGGDRPPVEIAEAEGQALTSGAWSAVLQDDGTRGFGVLHREDGAYRVEAPGIARALVSPDGDRIVYERLGSDPRWWLLVMAQVLPLSATLRGHEPLHAASVVWEDRCIALAAESGAGKSSVATELLVRGATLMTDDVVALSPAEEGVLAHPGPGLLSLDADAERRLPAGAEDRLGPPQPLAGKFFHRIPQLAGSRGLDALVLLRRERGGSGEVERIAAPPLALLHRSSFVTTVRDRHRLVRQLDLHARIAETVPLLRITSPPEWDARRTADAVCEALEAF